MKTLLLSIGLLASSFAWAGEPGSGGGCSETCSLSDAPEGQIEAEFRESLVAWLGQPMADASLPLETLLYYGESTRHFLSSLSDLGLSNARQAFLQAELDRDQVYMEMRVVDDEGQVRGTLKASGIPFGEKQHLRFEGTGSLGHLETGGRVRRVGLAHLWSRW